MKNSFKTLFVSLWGFCVGCQSGAYKITTTEDSAASNLEVPYYEIVNKNSSDAEKFFVNSDDGKLYDEGKIPIEVIEGKEDFMPDQPGWSGVLWMFTVGLFPMCHSEYMTQDIVVKSPIGEKSGAMRIDAKWWTGWMPIFAGYPMSADERIAKAELPNAQIQKRGRDRLVQQLAGEFSYTDYVAFAKRENANRKKDLGRIIKIKNTIDDLTAKGNFAEAENLLAKTKFEQYDAARISDMAYSIAVKKIVAEMKVSHAAESALLKDLISKALNGDAEAACELGIGFDYGRGVKQDHVVAAKWYEVACIKSSAKALCELGGLYKQGAGVKKDAQHAVELYRKAIALGSSDGMFRLGICYFEGSGVEKDLKESFKWYEKASTDGNADALNRLGVCYAGGHGVTKDDKKACACFRKAAEKGHMYGMYNLGEHYYSGHGVTQSYEEAVKWYRKAAEKNCPEALNMLGVCYQKGNGIGRVDDRYKEAVKWYKKAAELGSAWGMRNLGSCYEEGNGVDKNEMEAISWYRKAIARGNDSAKKDLTRFGGFSDTQLTDFLGHKLGEECRGSSEIISFKPKQRFMDFTRYYLKRTPDNKVYEIGAETDFAIPKSLMWGDTIKGDDKVKEILSSKYGVDLDWIYTGSKLVDGYGRTTSTSEYGAKLNFVRDGAVKQTIHYQCVDQKTSATQILGQIVISWSSEFRFAIFARDEELFIKNSLMRNKNKEIQLKKNDEAALKAL